MSTSTPAKQGYAMPAEWQPHEATWISWPHPEGNSFPGAYAKVIPAFVKMAEALAHSEIVRINVKDAEQEKQVRGLLKGAPPERLEFFHIATNEPWCRDHGPIFVVKKDAPRLAAINFGFNAWGYKLSPFEEDDEAATHMGKKLGVPVFEYDDFILEGGSIEVNGKGTVLTTESCLLNPNRNSHLNRSEIETKLRECLGVSQVLWLGDGIEGDDTDGHVDDITRFVSEDTVVTVVEEDEDDPNFEPLRVNFERLQTMNLKDGSPLNVIKLPMPARIARDGQRLPASYANFYIANTSVLLPVYQDTNDAWAASVLKEVFPTREIVPIDCRELIWGLGAFHCLTQQQPAV
ncbi:agmatine deiminase [Terrimicrobium sacchariphilum]|uniref:Agmatine deiminase n=1 Tax=Terrimicrobium sacchariphilum TaxID=690879 RepID=A0A146G6J4_TERSA|nr:agmatine deiminase family protein [Terrimicrobium sacchariphilum]GAT33141.1 agmatine deiminase [Terrimicrobium sacchariphilum]